MTTVTRRASLTHLAGLVAGMGLAAIVPSTSPTPALVGSGHAFSEESQTFPALPEALAVYEEVLHRLEAAVERVDALDHDLYLTIDQAVGDFLCASENRAAALLHEHLLATYRSGARLLIEIRPDVGGAS